MARLAYKVKRFNRGTQEVIYQAIDILNDYERQGFDLTLRQLYYQFVSKELIPNTDKSYKRLGTIINDARMAGQIDWNHIVDRGRNLASWQSWDDPTALINDMADSYRVDKWMDQPNYVEVWVEKEALSGVVARPCSTVGVPYFACKGYTSQSEMWGAAQRIRHMINLGKHVTILHLGDHDPSGIDMTRDIEDRLSRFLATDLYRDGIVEGPEAYSHVAERFEVNRIALNMDQVETYSPPPNPSKTTDSRYEDYYSLYGDQSWELDALNPTILSDLILADVHALVDDEKWKASVALQQEGIDQLALVKTNWERVIDFVENEL